MVLLSTLLFCCCYCWSQFQRRHISLQVFVSTVLSIITAVFIGCMALHWAIDVHAYVKIMHLPDKEKFQVRVHIFYKLYSCHHTQLLWWTHGLFHLIMTTDVVTHFSGDVEYPVIWHAQAEVLESVHKITFASLSMDHHT